MTRWSDLTADSGLLVALNTADQIGEATSGARADARTQSEKKNWSSRFADACARMVAAAVAQHPAFSKSEVRPNEKTKAEPVTFLVGGKRKRVDVVVSSPGVGLQLGISLKGMNFRDQNGLQFDKNLTGRTYELEDEVRVVRRTLPMAFMTALYFLPIASTEDKTKNSASSFAHTVEHLRARVGRNDPHSDIQADRLDMAIVALYVPGDQEAINQEKNGKPISFEYHDTLPRGVVRYFDVTRDPPRRGRPVVESTYDLPELIVAMASAYGEFNHGPAIEWAEPEA